MDFVGIFGKTFFSEMERRADSCLCAAGTVFDDGLCFCTPYFYAKFYYERGTVYSAVSNLSVFCVSDDI